MTTAANDPTPSAGRSTLDVAKVRALTLHCRRCQHVIGEMLGPRALRLGGAVIRQRLTYYCAVCRRRWHWRPAGDEGQG